MRSVFTADDAPFPNTRSPLSIADETTSHLHRRSPRRFGRVYLRVTNGQVAITGSVPTPAARTYAVQAARLAFRGLPVVDALEVRNRRSFAAA